MPNENKTAMKFYQEATKNWWIWYLEMPNPPSSSNHAFLDTTGVNCNVNQIKNDSNNLWFLSGNDLKTSGGETANKECNIPSGKFIVLPILVWECSKLENGKEYEVQQMVECAKKNMEDAGKLLLKYDNNTMDNDQIKGKLGIETKNFNVTVPENNVFAVKLDPVSKGNTISGGYGYWAIFSPPPIGTYDIHFRGAFEAQKIPVDEHGQIKYDQLKIENKLDMVIDTNYRIHIIK